MLLVFNTLLYCSVNIAFSLLHKSVHFSMPAMPSHLISLYLNLLFVLEAECKHRKTSSPPLRIPRQKEAQFLSPEPLSSPVLHP